MEMIRARDIMIPLDDYPHIPYWFTLRQAMAEMENFQLDRDGRQSLPRVVLVFDEAYKLLGLVRRRDIMRGLEPRFLLTEHVHHSKGFLDVHPDPDLAELTSEAIVKRIREQSERPVSDVMIPIKLTVDHDDLLQKIVNVLVENNMSLIPVLRDAQVVGVVRTVEVFHELGKLVL